MLNIRNQKRPEMKKKSGEKNWFVANVLSIKGNQTFMKLKNCSQQCNRSKII